MIRLHNTLTKKTEEFTPLVRNQALVYTCGPTVYNYLHVGNWVAFVRWDILIRVLRANGYDTKRVMNITDVGHLVSDADEGEDKMEKGARREGKTVWQVAEFYTKDFLDGMEKLNLLSPEYITKATDFIKEQIDLIKVLEAKGYTYVIDDGVYFDTSKFPTYADFAQLDLKALKAGARVEYNSEKKHPSDFALWKLTPAGEHRDMEWESPWGKGFPGWHIECSAMALSKLGETLDIHTGGIDHIPVHHTNEIAQSEAATGKRFSNYWLHANFLTVDGTKISKSLNNGYTLQDLQAKDYSPMDFRMFVLQSNYRTESNFTWDNLTAAKHRLAHWRAIAQLRWQTYDTLIDDDDKDTAEQTVSLLASKQALIDILSDDLDTPGALALIDEAFSRVENKELSFVHQDAFEQLLETIDELLGLDLLKSTPDISEEQKLLIVERQRAREANDWSASDKARDALAKQGIKLKDTPHGPIWSRE